METIRTEVRKRGWLGWAIFGGTMAIVFGLGLLASVITERRAEGAFSYVPQVSLSQFESRNEAWGQNFPKQFQSYYQTADTTFASKYGGSATVDMLEHEPEMVVVWAGYAFSKDYKQGRGHYYAVEDVYQSLRTGGPKHEEDGPQSSTCWTCKSPDVPRLMNEMGVEEFYKGKWAGKGHEVVNPIGCADCHDADNMNLRITRPALIEAYQRMGKDIQKASHQEMRSLVCAQCHVEYHFKPEGNYLNFPWDKGLTVENMEDYYDQIQHKDWLHPLSKAPMLKAQHPDWELYQSGIHAQRGVSCADCHMPYKSEGGQKFTDHKLQSPLANMNNSCQVCHRESEGNLLKNVYERQDKVQEGKRDLLKVLARLHIEAKHAWDLGATEAEMAPILTLIRHAQWRWDFVAASHGGPFHAPLESSRIISTGLHKAQDARVKLARILAAHGYNQEVPMPDISTKAKAQAYIGLDVEKMKEEKKEFLQTVLPEWLKKAQAKELTWRK
jgi:nitrite reductase (cytochrome c-552)